MNGRQYANQELDVQIGETGKYLFQDVAVFQIVADVRLSMLFEGWDIILKSMSEVC